MWLSELGIFFFKKILVLTSTSKTHSCAIFFYWQLNCPIACDQDSCIESTVSADAEKPEHDNLVPTRLSQECMSKYATRGHVVPFGNNENQHQYRIVSITPPVFNSSLPLWTGVCLNLQFIRAYCTKKKVLCLLLDSHVSCLYTASLLYHE